MGIARSQTKVAVKRLRARGRITTALEDDHMSFRTVWLASAAVALTLGFSATCAAQETPGAATTTMRPMSSALAPITQAMLDGAGKDSKNWLHSNGSYEQTRFYTGRQINSKNVGKLKPAFVFQTAVLDSMET